MKNEDAVSEVVGVMILLTITVVLAAVVALVAASAVGDTETPLKAEITAVGVSGGEVIFELISGEPFALSDIRVVLGVREDSTKTASFAGTEMIPLVSGTNTIFLGDRFTLDFDDFVSTGDHLTYRFYDKTDRPFSSGEIKV
ncbi:MAG: type IV pilin [Methanocorpusculum parvum]|nr:type IV pilin [Methanocorpusculum parvum]